MTSEDRKPELKELYMNSSLSVYLKIEKKKKRGIDPGTFTWIHYTRISITEATKPQRHCHRCFLSYIFLIAFNVFSKD